MGVGEGLLQSINVSLSMSFFVVTLIKFREFNGIFMKGDKFLWLLDGLKFIDFCIEKNFYGT